MMCLEHKHLFSHSPVRNLSAFNHGNVHSIHIDYKWIYSHHFTWVFSDFSSMQIFLSSLRSLYSTLLSHLIISTVYPSRQLPDTECAMQVGPASCRKTQTEHKHCWGCSCEWSSPRKHFFFTNKASWPKGEMVSVVHSVRDRILFREEEVEGPIALSSLRLTADSRLHVGTELGLHKTKWAMELHGNNVP